MSFVICFERPFIWAQSRCCSSKRLEMTCVRRWFLKSCSIKVKKKCTEKWRWPSRKLKTWYMWNNITIIIFPKKDFSYFDLYRVYTGSFLWTVQNYLALAPKIFAFTPSLKAQIIDNLLTFTLLQRNAFKNVISVLLYPLDWEAHFG